MEQDKKSLSLTIAWITLTLLGAIIALGAAISLYTAYHAPDDPIAGISLSRLAEVDPGLPAALRGRRATAAFYAFSFGVLFAWVAASGFRRRQRWARYAMLLSLGTGAVLSLLRVHLLGIRPGSEVPGLLLIVLALAMVISARDFR